MAGWLEGVKSGVESGSAGLSDTFFGDIYDSATRSAVSRPDTRDHCFFLFWILVTAKLLRSARESDVRAWVSSSGGFLASKKMKTYCKGF